MRRRTYETSARMAARKDEKRRRFLSVALRMFGRHGYHATTVPMIVAASRSSTGCFYSYFRNKEDVFAAALQSLGESIAAALNEAIAGTADPLLQMKAAVERLMTFLAERPDEARILLVESSGLTPRLERVRRGITASHARSVEQALTGLSGALAPLDPAIAARCWVGAVYEAAYHWLELPGERRVPVQHLAREVALFNLRAIGSPEEAL
jgi:TetR/AcrR family fatty acid metabolism transcriptional regulator